MKKNRSTGNAMNFTYVVLICCLVAKVRQGFEGSNNNQDVSKYKQ